MIVNDSKEHKKIIMHFQKMHNDVDCSTFCIHAQQTNVFPAFKNMTSKQNLIVAEWSKFYSLCQAESFNVDIIGEKLSVNWLIQPFKWKQGT